MKRALIISVDGYRHFTSFAGRVNHDGLMIRQMIGNPIFGAYRAVISEDDDEQIIARKIGNFLSAANRPDQLILYYVGHADRFPGNPFSLTAVDTHPGTIATQTLGSEALVAQLFDCPSQEISVILDCCHSAHFVAEIRRRVAADPTMAGLLANNGRSIEVLASGNESYVHGDRTRFSRAIIDSIRSGAAGGRKPMCTIEDLAQHLLLTGEVSSAEKLFDHHGATRDHWISNSPNHRETIAFDTWRDLHSADLDRKVTALSKIMHLLDTGSSEHKRRAHDILTQFINEDSELIPVVRSVLAPWLASRGKAERQRDRAGFLIIYNTRNLCAARIARGAFGSMRPKPCMFDLDAARDYQLGNVNLMDWLATRDPTLWILDHESMDGLRDRDRDLTTVLETFPDLDALRGVYLIGTTKQDEKLPFVTRSRWFADQRIRVEDYVASIRDQLNDNTERLPMPHISQYSLTGVVHDPDLFFSRAEENEKILKSNQRSEPSARLPRLMREPKFIIFRQASKYVMAICDIHATIDENSLRYTFEDAPQCDLATEEELAELGFQADKVDPMFLDPNNKFSRIYVDANLLFQHLMFPHTQVIMPRYDKDSSPRERISISTFMRSLQQINGESRIVFANITRTPKARDKILWSLIDANFTHTRFAPSPSNSLHMGSLRTALFAYLFAARIPGEGRFHVRFDDTNLKDQVNATQNVKTIKNDLTWAGIPSDSFYRQTDREARRNYSIALSLLQRSGKCVTRKNNSITLSTNSITGIHHYWLDLKRGPQIRHKIPLRASNGRLLDYSLTTGGAVENQVDLYRYKFAGAVDDVIHNSLVIRDIRQDHSYFTERQAAIMAMVRECLAFPRDAGCRKLGDQLRHAAKRRDANMAESRATPFPCPPMYLHVTRVTDQDGETLSKRKLHMQHSISYIRKNFLYFPETIVAWCIVSFGTKARVAAGLPTTTDVVRVLSRYGVANGLVHIARRFSFSALVDIPQKDRIRVSGLDAIERAVIREMSPRRLGEFAGEVLARHNLPMPVDIGDFLVRLHDRRSHFAGCPELAEIILCYGRQPSANEALPNKVEIVLPKGRGPRSDAEIAALPPPEKAGVRLCVLGRRSGASISTLRYVLGSHLFSMRIQQGIANYEHAEALSA